VVEHDESFRVEDARGQEESEGRRSAMRRLTKADAWKMAANFAKLPELLKKPA
jgi:hypothetical protein